MGFTRLALIAAAAFTLNFGSSLRADEIYVQFSGTISLTDVPGEFVGETFSGGFSYSTTDPFVVTVDGLSEYSLVSPLDSAFGSVGGLSVFIAPPDGLTATLGQGPLIIDSDPNQDYFSIQTASGPARRISIQMLGDLNFLSSSSLPDPFNAGHVTLGPESLPTSVGFFFGGYSAEGDITEISTVPEPRGVAWVLGILALIALGYRCSVTVSRS